MKTRSAMKREPTLQSEDRSCTNMPAMAANTFNIPQPSSSRAQSVAHNEAPSSDSTVRDEDVGTQTSNEAVDGEDAIKTFGQRSRERIEVIRRLESLGIDATLSSLPKFVVVGDQSHGKSSAVEGICGISLPRSSGTCTRCPFRITTTATRPGQSWSCKITLTRRFVIQPTGKVLDRQTEDPADFTTVTDRADLERVLRLAQIAILNPKLDPVTVLHFGGPPDNHALSFSLNAINLYISGDQLPELSVVDLPGSINVAPNESEQHLVGMIEDIIKRYVNDDKALILLVASMDQDLETSTAFRLVGGCKALGRSTGVLTKPDLLGTAKDRINNVKRTLNGSVFKLGGSWFVTKNSSQEDLDRGVTHQKAREQEASFFLRHPWSTELVDHEHRFGTKNLQDCISHRLVEHIGNELPEIVERVRTRVYEVSQQLNLMPERPVFPMHTVMREIQNLTSMATRYTRGDDDTFRAKFKEYVRVFDSNLQAARPRILLGTPGYVKPVLSLESEEEGLSDAPTPSKKRKTNGGRPTCSAPSGSTPRPTRIKQEGQPSTPSKLVLNLEEIHEAIDRASSSNLPDQVHPRATDGFILQALSPWPVLTTNLLNKVRRLVNQMLAKCVTVTLGAREGTQLFAQTGETVGTFCDQIFEDEKGFIDHLVECETHRPASYGNAIMQQTADVKLELEELRLKERLDEHFDTLEAKHNVKVPMGDKRRDKGNDEDFVIKTLGADKYGLAVTAMGMPLAYYDLASSRLVDTVAAFLERGVIHAIETKLQGRLCDELRVMDEAHCAELLAEDPEREAQRQRLIAEKARLEEALKELEGLPGEH